MPHLSPLKWFYIYSFMMLWMMILYIKMNFIIQFYPNKKKKMLISNKIMNWKI
uniref:ATP synthase F0 subunit 8 n=1 Tax=Anterhynchium abdominale TaxID=1589846 RepID=A0A6M9ATL3_9HYME|nr:ATP synthase F0 subunit 8 [Anterhynchium abdominale]